MPAKRARSSTTATTGSKPATKAHAAESNEPLAAAFDELKMYEAKLGDRWAGSTYDKVARAIRAHKSVIKAGADVAHLDGIGKASVAKIDEFISTGSLKKLNEFKDKFGPIPGLQSGKSAAAGGAAKANKVTAAQKKQIAKAAEGYESKKIDELKDVLRRNDQLLGGTKGELVHRCAEGEVLGALPRCPVCGAGKLKFDAKSGMFKCPGYMDDDEFKPCFFKSGDVDRVAWKP